MNRNLLPKMVAVSRNCVLTNQLCEIFKEKLTDTEINDLYRWLQIVEDEKNIEINRENRKFRF